MRPGWAEKRDIAALPSAPAVRTTGQGPRPAASGGTASLASFGPSLVLALQRSAGNQAITGALAARAAQPSAAPRGGARDAAPSPDHLTTTVVQRDTLDAVRRFVGRLGQALRDAQAAQARPSSWHSRPAPPPGGVLAIRAHEGSSRHAAGVTEVPGPPPPELVMTTERGRDGQWRARVGAPAPINVTPTSMYPAPGLHDLPDNPNRSGVPQKNLIEDDVSLLVRRGEEEHLDDIHWALQLTYVCIINTLRRLSTQQPPPAPTEAAAREATRRWVCGALPPQLRWQGDDPFRTWVRAYTALTRVTYERDDPNRWHSLPRTMVSDRAVLARHGVTPGSADVYRTMTGGQIDQHGSAALVRARFDSLPVPAGGPAGPA